MIGSTMLVDIIKKTAAPLISLFIFTVGSGLFMTLLAVRLHSEGASSLMIGAMTGAFYAGLVLGSFRNERLIFAIGHIRAFAGFASILAVMYLMHGVTKNVWVWLGLRLISGYTTAGLFVVIESWLLTLSSIKTRGQVLAIYMVSFYAAQALGQLLLNVPSQNEVMLFIIAAILSSLSVIPVCMSRIQQPQFEQPSALSFKSLYQKTASGIVGCFCAGMLLGALYGLMPTFLVEKTGSNEMVSFFMFLVIIGGMALQYPVGRISDYVERRFVVVVLSFFAALMSVLAIWVYQYLWLASIFTFIFGGLIFTIYPVCVSYGCDVLDQDDIVAGSQGLLLAYSLGAMFGPLLAPFLIRTRLGENGLFVFFGLIALVLVIFFLWRRAQFEAAPQEEYFIPMPQTTPLTAELDPRSDAEHELIKG